MKLDRNRPYGQVFGDAQYAYEQDGKLFDHQGEEVGAEPVATEQKKPGPKPKEQSQIDAQLEG